MASKDCVEKYNFKNFKSPNFKFTQMIFPVLPKHYTDLSLHTNTAGYYWNKTQTKNADTIEFPSNIINWHQQPL